MTINELIELLSQLDGNLRVFYEENCGDVMIVSNVTPENSEWVRIQGY